MKETGNDSYEHISFNMFNMIAFTPNKAINKDLLDLTAAFDTISVDLMLNHLKFRFGFTGDILEWLIAPRGTRGSPSRVSVHNPDSYCKESHRGVS